MKKLLLVLLSFFTLVQGQNIDECKVDLYYATDIILPEDEQSSEKLWRLQSIELLKKYPKIQKKIGDTKVSYNLSDGLISDVLVEIKQYDSSGMTYTAFRVYILAYLQKLTRKKAGFLLASLDKAAAMIYEGTLSKQKEAYNKSIESGRGVVVVAHSIGNLFTEEVYKSFSEEGESWKEKYFHTIAVASTQSEIINNGQGITFDNDLVYSDSLQSNDSEEVVFKNPNRYDYGFTNIYDMDVVYEDQLSAEYHKFEYYLGYPVEEMSLINDYSKKVETKTRQTNIAKDMITQWLYDEVVAHKDRKSQWEVDEEFDKNTEDYRISVKHKYKPTDIKLEERLFPFNVDKKVHQVAGKYVKASCGGNNITATWDGQKANEFWLIDNVEEEKIKGEVLLGPRRFYYSCTVNVASGMRGSNYYGFTNTNDYMDRTSLKCYSYAPSFTLSAYEVIDFPTFTRPTSYELNVVMDIEGKKLYSIIEAQAHEYLDSVFQNIKNTYGDNTYRTVIYDKDTIDCEMKWSGFTKKCRKYYTLLLER